MRSLVADVCSQDRMGVSPSAGVGGQAGMPHAQAKPREVKQGWKVRATWRPSWHDWIRSGMPGHQVPPLPR
jgi:hypothetical protein